MLSYSGDDFTLMGVRQKNPGKGQPVGRTSTVKCEYEMCIRFFFYARGTLTLSHISREERGEHFVGFDAECHRMPWRALNSMTSVWNSNLPQENQTSSMQL